MKLILILTCLMALMGNRVLAQTDRSDRTFIRHTVVFTLKYSKKSAEENEFLAAAQKLASIPGVHHFECLRQVSSKNNFDFGLSMEFDNAKTYAAYSAHPDHDAFVKKYWMAGVSNFLELDFQPLSK